MSQPAPSSTTIAPIWVGVGFAVLSIALLIYAGMHREMSLPVLVLLMVLLLLGPASGVVAVMSARFPRVLVSALLVLSVASTFATVVLSGGAASPLWVALLIPVCTALLAMPGLPGAGIAAAIWLAYGSMVLVSPPGWRLDA
ncbi:MAG: hypothetical protein HGA19_11210, partial [Oscillochloris sp.]|nr:hypothetical protein [Oscillochloris sp.]